VNEEAEGNGSTWLYVAPTLHDAGLVNYPGLASVTERDRVKIEKPPLEPTRLRRGLDDRRVEGVILEMGRGWPGRHQLVATLGLLGRYHVIYYWPEEAAAERIDSHRLAHYWALWVRAKIYMRRNPMRELLTGAEVNLVVATEKERGLDVKARATEILADPRPGRLKTDADGHVPGWGVYLRTDYWAPIETGGSYGHTCYVAKELAARSDEFVCLMANRFALLDELKVRQVTFLAHTPEANEQALLAASPVFNLQLRPVLEAIRPAYIYERACLGNVSGAQLSRQLGIPYLVEYNGSEVSMMRSFGNGGYTQADLFELIEEAAFAQASVVSVVSRPIADSLVARGVDPTKILVNPNGADPDAYRPASSQERDAVRQELGFTTDDVVIGFTGTFGGWHGAEVLAKAIPDVVSRCPEAAFLLIGDGPARASAIDAVEAHQLASRVVMPGRVPHAAGARLLRACDIFVCPHASHMVDGPFFGSPTKLFEYMAMGRAIVASDLEQIGEVLRPALSPSQLARQDLEVNGERAVLCAPGDVADLTDAISGLVARPDLVGLLGRNARQALLEQYTWAEHVRRLLEFAASTHVTYTTQPKRDAALKATEAQRPAPPDEPITAGSYKAEVARQWDSDPCGSHYVDDVERHTLKWFEEAERYRYQEYAQWMPEVMEFAGWSGKQVLEVGAGMGTDLAQYARNGAETTDCDLSGGHLDLAQENFALRGLRSAFVQGDVENLPFADESFDMVYSNGVVHHTPATAKAIAEMHRVIRPGGRAIVMVYAERSLHYWRMLVGDAGLRHGLLEELSIGEIMSRTVELSSTGARPLVKVYTAAALRPMFSRFDRVSITKRQLTPAERPPRLEWVPAPWLSRVLGWNLIVKADKARRR
jgi:glycosyltransferase involved in cell wall biosynthesis/ubiquinone/menaquinone biosynthesis C-methylase UbiE